MRGFAVVVQREPTGGFSAWVPDLPGCASQGATQAETRANLREAIACHLDGLRADGLPIPAPRVSVEAVEVEDWGNEPCLPSDLHAMREGDRAAAEGRLISDAVVGRHLRQLVRRLQRERDGGSKWTTEGNPTRSTRINACIGNRIKIKRYSVAIRSVRSLLRPRHGPTGVQPQRGCAQSDGTPNGTPRRRRKR